MNTFYFPQISAEDYPAFENMPGLDLPATYSEWLQRQARYKVGARKNGDAIIEVHVHPSEFVRHLQATKAPADLKELQAFASAKAGVAATDRDPSQDQIEFCRDVHWEDNHHGGKASQRRRVDG